MYNINIIIHIQALRDAFIQSSLYMFRVSTTLIIRSTQNCNYSLRYCAATSLQRGQATQSKEMQHNAVYLLLSKFTLHVSGVNHTHHQEHTKL